MTSFDEFKADVIEAVRSMYRPDFIVTPERIAGLEHFWRLDRSLPRHVIKTQVEIRKARWLLWKSCRERIIDDLQACNSMEDMAKLVDDVWYDRKFQMARLEFCAGEDAYGEARLTVRKKLADERRRAT